MCNNKSVGWWFYISDNSLPYIFKFNKQMFYKLIDKLEKSIRNPVAINKETITPNILAMKIT